ncbi:hypothetical protein ACFX2A_018150 [Malus domestica]
MCCRVGRRSWMNIIDNACKLCACTWNYICFIGSECLCMCVDKHVINVRSMSEIAGFPLGILNSALYSYLLPSLQLCSAEYRRVRILVTRF